MSIGNLVIDKSRSKDPQDKGGGDHRPYCRFHRGRELKLSINSKFQAELGGYFRL